MSRLVAMVVGLGRIGWQYDKERKLGSSHVGAYVSNPDIDNIIAVDSDPNKLKELAAWLDEDFRNGHHKIVMGGQDYMAAIKEYKPTIISVCTPTSTHKEIMLDLCHRDGPDVICLEKPVASSVQEAQEIANRAAYVHGLTKEAGHAKPKVAVNFSRRWHPNWVKVKEILTSGKIGKPLLAVGHHPGPLLRSGVHMLDLFNWYFGTPDKARALSEKISWMTKKYPEIDDGSYNAEIRYNINGPLWQTSAFLLGADLGDTDYQLFDLQIFCEHGSIGVGDNGRTLMVGKVAPSVDYGGLNALTLDPDNSTQLGQTWDMMGSMVDDLVACVKDPDRYPACGLESGVNAQILVSMIRQSKGNWTTPNQVDWKEVVKSL